MTWDAFLQQTSRYRQMNSCQPPFPPRQSSQRPARRFNLLVTTLFAWALLMMTGRAALAGDAQVYKGVDAQGNVVYTDKPSTPKAFKTTVQVHEPSADDLAHLEQQRQVEHAVEVQRLQNALSDRASEAQQARAQKDRQARCQSARNRFYAMKDATRIYERDAQGNRVYLPDEAAEAKRAAARKAMDGACAP